MKRTPSYEIFVDGASRGNPGPAGIGAVCFDGTARPVWKISKPIGRTTNNVAEYLALIYALTEALGRGHAHIAVKTDSELLARQIAGRYKVKHPDLQPLHAMAVRLLRGFRSADVAHVPRAKNAAADRLAGQAADKKV